LRFRIDPELQKRLEGAAKKSGRTLTAEITERLKQSFDMPALVDRLAPDVSSIESELSDVSGELAELQIRVQAIVSHLGLPDPIEAERARKRAEWERLRARRAGRQSNDDGEKK
jgi:hypothetical protein